MTTRAKRGTSGIVVGDRVDGRNGPLGTVAGTREATDAQRAYVLVRRARLLDFAYTTYLVPVSWVVAVTDGLRGAHRVTLDVGLAEILGCPLLRADTQLRAEVVQRLASPVAGWFRAAAMQVAVRNGVVDLTGSAPSARDAGRAADSARRVPGVLGVLNHVVAAGAAGRQGDPVNSAAGATGT